MQLNVYMVTYKIGTDTYKCMLQSPCVMQSKLISEIMDAFVQELSI